MTRERSPWSLREPMIVVLLSLLCGGCGPVRVWGWRETAAPPESGLLVWMDESKYRPLFMIQVDEDAIDKISSDPGASQLVTSWGAIYRPKEITPPQTKPSQKFEGRVYVSRETIDFGPVLPPEGIEHPVMIFQLPFQRDQKAHVLVRSYEWCETVLPFSGY